MGLGLPKGVEEEHWLHARGAGQQEAAGCEENGSGGGVRGAAAGGGQAPGAEGDGGKEQHPLLSGSRAAGPGCHKAGHSPLI